MAATSTSTTTGPRPTSSTRGSPEPVRRIAAWWRQRPTITAFTPGVGNSCSPDYSFWEAYTRTQWNPVPQLDIGLQVMYTHHNTAYKGPAILAANGSRPAVVNGVIDDQNVWSAMFRWQRNFYP